MPPLVEELVPAPDVTAAFQSAAGLPGVAMLDSCLRQREFGRYSFLAANPRRVVEMECVRFGDDPFLQFQERLANRQLETIPELPPFQGGLIGVVSYELGHAWERWPFAKHDEFQFPALCVGEYDCVVSWDHQAGRAWILAHGDPDLSPAERRDDAAGKIETMRQVLRSGSGSSEEIALQTLALAPQFPFESHASITSDFSRDGYLRAVEKVIDHIHAGDIFQANLSQRLLIPQPGAPAELYLRLRRENPAPFAGYFAGGDWAIVSASPERFLKVDGRDVETRPIKGTRKRQSGPEADLYTRDELRESEKDRAENVMIVDLLRNDLSRVCEPHSIRVSKLCNVETYETVQHLVSEIHGRLEPPYDAWDLFRVAIPGGSITGAPKVRAMEIISEIEPTARGPYCGSLFYVGYDGRVDSSILIRTFLCRHGWAQCSVGGGIVAQSGPLAEYEETLHKAAGMLRAIG